MHSIESLKHLVDEMLAKSKRVYEYSRNRSATGLHRERIVESFVRRIAPKSFSIGSGFIYGASESSKQIDVIVYDDLNFAPLFDEGGYIVVLPESVIEVIEVKSFLDKTRLFGALENIESAKGLNPKIQGSIFAFDGMSKQKTFEHLGSYIEEDREILQMIHYLPESIVNLGNWVISSFVQGDAICYVAPKKISFEEQFLIYFSSLYYKLYGYRRKLLPEGVLPTLKSQGFSMDFSPGESDMKWIGSKRALREAGVI